MSHGTSNGLVDSSGRQEPQNPEYLVQLGPDHDQSILEDSPCKALEIR